MSTYDLEGLLDVVPIKRTELIGDALSTVVAFFRGPERGPGDPIATDPNEDESTELDWWQHYGYLSRPPEGSEALIVRLGAQAFAIASRAIQATGFGKLNEGDVALYSIGKNVIRLNASGTVSVMAQANGKQMVANLDPNKGAATIILGNKTSIQADEKQGITLMAQQGNITLAAPAGGIAFVSALGVENKSATIKLNALAGAPLNQMSANPGVIA